MVRLVNSLLTRFFRAASALSTRLNAAVYELLELIAELDELGEWGMDGFKSCAHWLAWRVGFDLGTAGEKVRVAKAFKALPKTSDALKRGAPAQTAPTCSRNCSGSTGLALSQYRDMCGFSCASF